MYHLIQFLIEPFPTDAKLEQNLNYKDIIKTLITQNLKMTYTKLAEKNTVVIQIQMWP